jgi:hypothetical protein
LAEAGSQRFGNNYLNNPAKARLSGKIEYYLYVSVLMQIPLEDMLV